MSLSPPIGSRVVAGVVATAIAGLVLAAWLIPAESADTGELLRPKRCPLLKVFPGANLDMPVIPMSSDLGHEELFVALHPLRWIAPSYAYQVALSGMDVFGEHAYLLTCPIRHHRKTSFLFIL